MARRRMIDPSIWQSEAFAGLSMLARLLFIGMFSAADDEGRGRARPVYLKSTIFPYDEELGVDEVAAALGEIEGAMALTLYEAGASYYAFDHWTSWQRVDKPLKSTIPPPPLVEGGRSGSGGSPEEVRSGSGGSPEEVRSGSGGKEKKGKQEKEREREKREKGPPAPGRETIPGEKGGDNPFWREDL